ncbi:unnamed protein product [Leptosia nina]|uniref:Uncharacterized protein n=1 Tax=Leptosia nina TaxID=320188 RepID=A0AAV1JSI4_9NEOP
MRIIPSSWHNVKLTPWSQKPNRASPDATHCSETPRDRVQPTQYLGAYENDIYGLEVKVLLLRVGGGIVDVLGWTRSASREIVPSRVGRCTDTMHWKVVNEISHS